MTLPLLGTWDLGFCYCTYLYCIPDFLILKYWIPPPIPYQLATSNFTNLAVTDSKLNDCRGKGFTWFLLSARVSSITSFQGPFLFVLQLMSQYLTKYFRLHQSNEVERELRRWLKIWARKMNIKSYHQVSQKWTNGRTHISFLWDPDRAKNSFYVSCHLKKTLNLSVDLSWLRFVLTSWTTLNVSSLHPRFKINSPDWPLGGIQELFP